MDSFLYLLYRYLSEEGQKPNIFRVMVWRSWLFSYVGDRRDNEPTIGGERSQPFMTLIGLMPVGLEYNGEECQKSIIQEELV